MKEKMAVYQKALSGLFYVLRKQCSNAFKDYAISGSFVDLRTWLMVTSIQRQPRYSANFSFIPRLALYRGFTVIQNCLFEEQISQK